MSGSARAAAATLPRPAARPRLGGALLSRGYVVTWLSLVVLIPIAALVFKSTEGGFGEFWDSVTQPQALDALRTTFLCALAVTVINSVMGLAIAWVLVRDEFRGKAVLNAVIDLPFALPTRRRRPDAARPLRQRQPARHQHRLHEHRASSWRSAS